jgi:hypothetical protein
MKLKINQTCTLKDGSIGIVARILPYEGYLIHFINQKGIEYSCILCRNTEVSSFPREDEQRFIKHWKEVDGKAWADTFSRVKTYYTS